MRAGEAGLAFAGGREFDGLRRRVEVAGKQLAKAGARSEGAGAVARKEEVGHLGTLGGGKKIGQGRGAGVLEIRAPEPDVDGGVVQYGDSSTGAGERLRRAEDGGHLMQV